MHNELGSKWITVFRRQCCGLASSYLAIQFSPKHLTFRQSHLALISTSRLLYRSFTLVRTAGRELLPCSVFVCMNSDDPSTLIRMIADGNNIHFITGVFVRFVRFRAPGDAKRMISPGPLRTINDHIGAYWILASVTFGYWKRACVSKLTAREYWRGRIVRTSASMELLTLSTVVKKPGLRLPKGVLPTYLTIKRPVLCMMKIWSRMGERNLKGDGS